MLLFSFTYYDTCNILNLKIKRNNHIKDFFIVNYLKTNYLTKELKNLLNY